MIRQIVTAALLTAAATGAQAITFTPDSNPAVNVSPAFGSAVAGGILGTNYKAFGVDFTWGNQEAIFNDPPHAFSGVNASGVVDLVSDVNGRIVKAGTLSSAVTNYFYAEAGFAAAGSLTLTVYNSALAVIGSATNGDPLGTHGRTTFAISTPGIAYFNISGNDSYGVNEIRLNTPTGGVPEASTWALMIAGFGMVGIAARRRSLAAAA